MPAWFEAALKKWREEEAKGAVKNEGKPIT